MTAIPIRVLPQDQDVLRAKAKKVRRTDDPAIQRLIDDMIDSMYAAHGVGVAAPQVGVSLRLVVIGIPGEEPFALVNPEIVKRSGERRVAEGCLSVPGYRGEITRSLKVVAKGLDRHGKAIRIHAENTLLAQALEHEIDHVNGILYIDHLASTDDLYPVDERSTEDDDEDEDEDDPGASAPGAEIQPPVPESAAGG